MQSFVVEATQPGMETPEDGALRITVEGGQWEARQLLMAVLKVTRDINQSFQGMLPGGHDPVDIECEYLEAILKVTRDGDDILDQELKVGSWTHTIREKVPA